MKKLLAAILIMLALSSNAFAASETYVLLERDGIVGVFKAEDTGVPEFLTDIVVLSLPRADREKLKAGILVEGKEALLEILEDLGS